MKQMPVMTTMIMAMAAPGMRDPRAMTDGATFTIADTTNNNNNNNSSSSNNNNNNRKNRPGANLNLGLPGRLVRLTCLALPVVPVKIRLSRRIGRCLECIILIRPRTLDLICGRSRMRR